MKSYKNKIKKLLNYLNYTFFIKIDIKDLIIKLRDSSELGEEQGKNVMKSANYRYKWEKQEEKFVKIYELLSS